MRWLKLILCRLSLGFIHWEGRNDGGGMGDAIRCDICGRDDYGVGWVVHKVPRR